MDFSTALGTIVGIVGLVQILVLGVVAYIIQRSGKEIALLELRLISSINEALKSYVTVKQFTDLQEFITKEFTRLRDWKHEIADPLIRSHDGKIIDIKEVLRAMGIDIRKLQDDDDKSKGK